MARKNVDTLATEETSAEEAGKGIKLSMIVARTIRQKIASGELPLGSNLPPEPELLSMFSVSRPTLREALRILESEELISISAGDRSGAVITGPNLNKAAEYSAMLLNFAGVTVHNLHEARAHLEPIAIMSLSAEDGRAAGEQLDECVQELDRLLIEGNLEEFVRQSNEFHSILLGSVTNLVIVFFTQLIATMTEDAFPQEFREYSDQVDLERHLSYSLMAYRKLVIRLKEGDIAGAAKIWRKHMENGLSYIESRNLGNSGIWTLYEERPS